jgi:KH domain
VTKLVWNEPKTAFKMQLSMSHVGFLTLPDRSVFPRIVGTKGANVARLRAQTGADITVSRENSTIVIIGVLNWSTCVIISIRV